MPIKCPLPPQYTHMHAQSHLHTMKDAVMGEMFGKPWKDVKILSFRYPCAPRSWESSLSPQTLNFIMWVDLKNNFLFCKDDSLQSQCEAECGVESMTEQQEVWSTLQLILAKKRPLRKRVSDWHKRTITACLVFICCLEEGLSEISDTIIIDQRGK